jgi:hypothetical protein
LTYPYYSNNISVLMDVTARKKKGLNFRLFEGKIGRAILIASFVILTIGLPLAYLFTKNQTPVSSWFNNSWEYRQAITVGNSASLKTNYDVLVEVDTASLIGAGKIQNDCDDIRFVDNDDSTTLSFWIESGCNTATTQIWFRVPSLPNGGKTVYMYYGNGSAVNAQMSWAGETLSWHRASCPVGWTRVSAADGKFLRGSSTYGQTGGSSTSSHTVSCSLSTYTGSYTWGVSGGAVSAVTGSHSHTGTATVDNASNVLPAYMNWVLCSKNTVALEYDSVSISELSSISGWTRTNDVDSKFPIAAASYGGGGGSDTHQHTVSAGTAVDSGSLAYSPASLATGGTITYPTGYAAHTFTSNGTFTPTVAMNIAALVVGGGGGGGGGSGSAGQGAGGGGGKVEYNASYLANTAISITVGSGGSGGTGGGGVAGTNGGNTIFGTMTANGGGGGGAGGYVNSNGLTGGNGGGGAPTAGTGGTSNDSGYAGGAGSNCNTPCRSGGGGGAGGAGTSAVSGPGNGGVGFNTSILGVSQYYGGGGGGSGGTQGGVAGSGGVGGGGAGSNFGVGGAGTVNTGGGGGGGGNGSVGGAGGSGIVILRYPYTSITTSSSSHTHATTGTTTSASSNVPEYVDMVYQVKLNNNAIPTTVIPMFSALPPLGWTRYTTLDNKFARGAATYGATGGNNNHTHTTDITAGTPVGTVNSATWASSVGFASTTHGHTCTNATSSSTSNIPPYFTVIYGTKNNNTNDSVTYTLNSEESNVPVPPTITAAQGLTTTSVRWNFIDNASNETGFKVFDMSGTLKATCVGANLTYCDETGLSVNTQYERQVKAYNANGDSLTYSSSTTRYTLAPVPTTTVTTVTEDSATVEVGSMANYNVDQSGWYYDCTQANCDNGSFNTWVTSTSLVDTGLNSNTEYSFRVKARNGDGVETAYSVSDSKYTLAPVPVISFSSVTSGDITLGTSNLNNFGVGQSAVMYECVSINSGECDTGNIWDATGAQTLTQLQTNKEYEFRAKARNGDGIETAYSSNYPITTAAANPLELSLSDVGSTSLRVTLNGDNNGNPSDTQYLVRHFGTDKYLNALTNTLEVTEYWGTYADFEEATGVMVNGLEDGVLQRFEVKARNSDDVETDYSNDTQVYTLLNTPTLVSGQALSSSSIRWNITENTDNEEGIKVYDGSNNLVATCNGADLSYCDETSMSPNTSNTRRVVVFNEDVESAKSNQESAYTRTNTPGAPTLSFGLNQVQVTINANSNPAPTLFSILEQSGQYVQSDGTLGVTEVKRTLADWATINVTGLSANTSYTFSVKAENGDATHQTTSSTASGYTFASGVSAPTVTGSTTTNIDVEINPSGNPSTTQYAIYHVGTDSYVDFGSQGATVGLVQNAVWATYTQWGRYFRQKCYWIYTKYIARISS